MCDISMCSLAIISAVSICLFYGNQFFSYIFPLMEMRLLSYLNMALNSWEMYFGHLQPTNRQRMTIWEYLYGNLISNLNSL